MQVKEFNDINFLIKEKIVNLQGNDQLSKLHTQMLINCSAGDKQAKVYVKDLIEKELEKLGYQRNQDLIDKIYSKNWGLGPLDKYDVNEIDEIMVHGNKVLIQKGGIEQVPEKFCDYDETLAVMRRCAEFDQKNDLNSQNAILATRRKDGSRINAVIGPVAKMPYLNIRKFDSFPPTTENMLRTRTLCEKEVDIIDTLVGGRANIVVIGEMGSGKTSFIKWMAQFYPKNLIVGSLETEFELNLDTLYPDRHWVQLAERLPHYPLPVLFATMLRMNVDIIMVGEARSYEANEIIKAMSRGHSGSMASAHSTDPEGMVDDFADMVLESGKSIDLKALRYRIARSVDIVIKLRKLPNDDKSKVCAGIYELTTNSEDMSFKSVPIVEFMIDEENPEDKGEKVFKNNISNKLKKKLNEYGLPFSKINKVFSDDKFLYSKDRV